MINSAQHGPGLATDPGGDCAAHRRTDAHYVICCRSRALVRLLARLRTAALSAALAPGACPDSSAALSLRAHALIGPPTHLEFSRAI